jgi:hypothetical protein
MRLRHRKPGRKAAGDKSKDDSAANVHEWDFPIIEVNPNCWLEKRSQFAAAGRKHGLSYPELLERIIERALARRPQVTV